MATIKGTAGRDNLLGTADDDIIDGGTGNDIIQGLAGADVLHGNDGNDTLYGDPGQADALFGDAGNDKLYGFAGNAVVDGGDGNDFASLDFRTYNGNVNFSVADNLAGTVTIGETGIRNVERVNISTGRGDDHLTGGAGNDTLSSLGGFNVMAGMGGNDRLEGGDSVDVLDGGSGNDVLLGGAGDDYLLSDNRSVEAGKTVGVDVIDGGSGFDTAIIDRSGASGSITFNLQDPATKQVLDNGTSVVDVEVAILTAGRGNDTLTGGDSNDWFDGGAGNDVIDGKGGADRLLGGAGNDSITGHIGDVLIDGGEGRDHAILDFRGHGGNVSFSVADNLGGTATIGETAIRNVESVNIRTGRGDDHLTGGAGNDTLSSLGGFNVMAGLGGNDRLEGGDGVDILDGGSGNDVLLGGAGDDALFSDNRINQPGQAVGVDVIDGGAGFDTAVIDRSGATGDITFSIALPSVLQVLDNGTTVVNVERVTLTAGRGNDILTGGSGDDYFDGGAGDDELIGGLGHDELRGGRGDDLLVGSTGADIIDGGDGNDSINSGYGARVVNGGRGIDNAYLDFRGFDRQVVFSVADNLAGTQTINSTVVSNIEQITLETGRGDDILVGGKLDDIFSSTGGRNQMFGKGGNDRLIGGDGEDYLDGGTGDDVLRGRDGADELLGGTGTDTASYSGSSDEYFVTQTADGFVIRDLTENRDGTDHLVSIERLSFTDGSFTLAEMLAKGSLPVAEPDAITTTENLSGTTNVLANDQDRVGGPLKLVSATSADTGILLGYNANGNLSVTPGAAYQALAQGETATTIASYVVESVTGHRATGTITVTIVGENDVPVAFADAFSVDEDSSLINLGVLGNDRDLDHGAKLGISSIDQSMTAGVVTLNPDGTVNYSPGAAFQHLQAGQVATDTFIYTVHDEYGVGTSTSVTITITGADEAPAEGPVAQDDDVALSAGQNAVILHELLANDIGEGLHIVGISPSSQHGAQIALSADGKVIYDPQGLFAELEPGQTSVDGFDYVVEDANGIRTTAHAAVTVTGSGKSLFEIEVDEDQSVDITTDLLARLHSKFGFGLHDFIFDTSRTIGSFEASGGHMIYTADDPLFDPLVGDSSIRTAVDVTFSDAQGGVHHGLVVFEIAGVTDINGFAAGAVGADYGVLL
ncbi:Ig-like domain-containing protein [Novosphingobium sp.]|uniref:Ig-like domain-containing protein n=1 Tax=Novosphingobium sp. TaxID=1874826 RepID=UPI002620781A|nr:Ig-like domain-containing protein [Novosphingobium sp.]